MEELSKYKSERVRQTYPFKFILIGGQLCMSLLTSVSTFGVRFMSISNLFSVILDWWIRDIFVVVCM